ncbi:MAG: methionine--tRNA ligase [Myxococcota bacterium]|jgi:methionyl-tRNA synthetase|nr:methionine--tRNA ligase [Myxococcota bacterium]
MGRTFYFTTPIYYVNAEPHIGHLYTTVLADTLKRYHQMMGDDVYFLTGTDEHGEKIAQVAAKKGVSTRALVDEVSGVFEETWKKIGINNDDFIRTTQPRHKEYVQQVLTAVKERGDIYFDEYTGLYCVGCERYLTPTELEEGLCPDHKTKPQEVKEANYFFRMGKYQAALLEHIEKNPGWIRPERFRNEVLSLLRLPLEDLCISRPKTRLQWGIDLPFDERFVTYVWFDALLNYPSALKRTTDGRDVFEKYWPECNHLIAKDIVKTHAIYWPTMCMAAGLPLPKHLDVHGYWLSGESKMSKSLGNVVRPLAFEKQFGIENLRYFFFREMKFGSDSSFTYELFVERYNADLANSLGNLLSRVASIVRKSQGGKLPQRPQEDEAIRAIAAQAKTVAANYGGHFEERRFHAAVDDIRALLSAGDKYINDQEPWRLVKDPSRGRELSAVLYTGLEVVRLAVLLLSPIMPRTCRTLLDYLGETRPLDGTVPFNELCAWGGLATGFEIGEVPRAFPRIDEAKLATVLAAAAPSPERATAPPPALERKPSKPEITIDDFSKVDLRVATIAEATFVQGADKLLRLMVDLGEGRLRQVFAGIRSAYPQPESLVGQQVVVVANLKPRQMKFGTSEAMVLAGGGGTSRLCAVTFAEPLEPGDHVS